MHGRDGEDTATGPMLLLWFDTYQVATQERARLFEEIEPWSTGQSVTFL